MNKKLCFSPKIWFSLKEFGLTSIFCHYIYYKKVIYFCHSLILNFQISMTQGIVDGSASKPRLRQDTGNMVGKTYHDIAPYLGAFGAYLMPQWPIYGSKGVSIYKNDRWNMAVNSRYFLSGQKAISVGQKRP